MEVLEPYLAALPAVARIWLDVLLWAILGTGFLQTAFHALQLPAAWRQVRQWSKLHDVRSSWHLLISEAAPPITLIVPAFNEEKLLVQSVQAMLALDYPDYEVIVVNDGSTDRTLERLTAAFSLARSHRAHEAHVPHAPLRAIYFSRTHPGLLVVDKENGGKSDAINAGINLARRPLLCVVDADSVVEGQSLLRAVQPFVEDNRTVAVGGTVRIINGCEVQSGQITAARLPRRFLPLLQSVEYARAFMMARLALSRWSLLTLVSGAFGIFSRKVAIEVGGFSHGTVAEDLELVVKIHRRMREVGAEYRVCYISEPVCWTQAPESLSTLGNQRRRWARGAVEVLAKHRDMLLSPRYGRIGTVALTYSLLVDLVGPVLELVAYVLLPTLYFTGQLAPEFAIGYAVLVFGLGTLVTIAVLILEEMHQRIGRTRDLLVLAGVAVLENFGYRQLNNLWRVMGIIEFMRRKTHWGVMARKHFISPAPEAGVTNGAR